MVQNGPYKNNTSNSTNHAEQQDVTDIQNKLSFVCFDSFLVIMIRLQVYMSFPRLRKYLCEKMSARAGLELQYIRQLQEWLDDLRPLEDGASSRCLNIVHVVTFVIWFSMQKLQARVSVQIRLYLRTYCCSVAYSAPPGFRNVHSCHTSETRLLETWIKDIGGRKKERICIAWKAFDLV